MKGDSNGQVFDPARYAVLRRDWIRASQRIGNGQVLELPDQDAAVTAWHTPAGHVVRTFSRAAVLSLAPCGGTIPATAWAASTGVRDSRMMHLILGSSPGVVLRMRSSVTLARAPGGTLAAAPRPAEHLSLLRLERRKAGLCDVASPPEVGALTRWLLAAQSVLRAQ